MTVWQDIERFESEAWYADVAHGFRYYLIVKGMQRWGASLFGLNVLAGHAFGFAATRTMNFSDFMTAFVGFHLAGALIALILWCRNFWKYGRTRETGQS